MLMLQMSRLFRLLLTLRARRLSVSAMVFSPSVILNPATQVLINIINHRYYTNTPRKKTKTNQNKPKPTKTNQNQQNLATNKTLKTPIENNAKNQSNQRKNAKKTNRRSGKDLVVLQDIDSYIENYIILLYNFNNCFTPHQPNKHN